MGQSSPSIVYGVKPAPRMWDRLHGESYNGLLDTFERVKAGVIAARDREVIAISKRTGKPTYEYESGRKCWVPGVPYEAEPAILGFTVAIGGRGEAGAPYLDGSFPLLAAERVFRKRLSVVVPRWDRFAEWMVGHGVSLPAAQLWFARDETA